MHRLTALVAAFLLAACSTGAPSVASILEAELQRNGAPGMLALVRRGDATSFASVGSADMSGSSISATTRFRVGSITKPIVAALVLLAVRDGAFGLDDTVGELMPGVLRDKPQVTIRQLLAHTSGVFDEGNDGNPTLDAHKIADPALREEAQGLLRDHLAGLKVRVPDRILVALAETHDRYNAPGMGYHYSNTGYQVLGMVLERATGTSLADLLRTYIVEPLGLTRTSLAPTDASTPDMHGYQPDPDNVLIDMTAELSWFGNGANGGVISTAEELLAIMDAIVSGRLLGTDLTDEMLDIHLAQYGLGIGEYALSCGTFYGHEGSVVGTRSIALVSATSGDAVVVALNVNSNIDPRLGALAETLVCQQRP